MSSWKTENWYVSHLNFLDEVTASITIRKKAVIHDVTLRDGGHSVGLVFGKDEQLEIAEALDDLGISRIEVSSRPNPEDVEAAKIVASSGLNADIFTFLTTAEGRAGIDIALKCGISNIVLGTAISDVAINAANLTREKVIAQIIDAVTYAKDHGLFVTFFTIDSTRADSGFAIQTVNAGVNEAHADSVAVVDSYGVATPEAMRYLTKKYMETVKGRVPVEVHCHNDFGLGLANAIAAFCAGAEVIHASFNGLGPKCGNPATEEVAVCLKILYGVDLNLRYEKLYGVSKLIEKLSKHPLAKNKPVVGEDVFSSESGSAIRSMEKPSYSPYNPTFVGQIPRLCLSKRSDLKAIQEKARMLEIIATEEQMKSMLKMVQVLSYNYGRAITDDEFKIIAYCCKELSPTS